MTTATHYSEKHARNGFTKFSAHARVRAQQRAIPSSVVPLVKAYGDRRYDGRGAVIYTMTRKSISKLTDLLGHTQQLDRLDGVYIVESVDDGTLITVGHRH